MNGPVYSFYKLTLKKLSLLSNEKNKHYMSLDLEIIKATRMEIKKNCILNDYQLK